MTTTPDPVLLREVSRRVLWLATSIVDAANAGRPNHSGVKVGGVKVGGHQAPSASMVDIMVALWFAELTSEDRVSVKPHASPVLHALNYLLGDLDESYLPTLRAHGGLRSYPSRLKDPDTVDFSTGSVGIGATAAIWAAMSRALEPWSYGIYSGGQSILVGTPSGVTLAPRAARTSRSPRRRSLSRRSAWSSRAAPPGNRRSPRTSSGASWRRWTRSACPPGSSA